MFSSYVFLYVWKIKKYKANDKQLLFCLFVCLFVLLGSLFKIKHVQTNKRPLNKLASVQFECIFFSCEDHLVSVVQTGNSICSLRVQICNKAILQSNSLHIFPFCSRSSIFETSHRFVSVHTMTPVNLKQGNTQIYNSVFFLHSSCSDDSSLFFQRWLWKEIWLVYFPGKFSQKQKIYSSQNTIFPSSVCFLCSHIPPFLLEWFQCWTLNHLVGSQTCELLDFVFPPAWTFTQFYEFSSRNEACHTNMT